MIWEILLGDAYHLPLRDEVVDVVVADPPYEVKRVRGKRMLPKSGRSVHTKMADTGYVTFVGREWFHEALRVLKPSGHLYIVCAIRELTAWLQLAPDPIDVLAWWQPNAASTSAYWRRGISGRSPVWRPILHYQKPPKKLIRWSDGYVRSNFIQGSLVSWNMAEAQPWPVQMPLRVLRQLLIPHENALVLDLFAGSGTGGIAGQQLGLQVVSVEMARDAVKVMKRRQQTPPMFQERDFQEAQERVQEIFAQ